MVFPRSLSNVPFIFQKSTSTLPPEADQAPSVIPIDTAHEDDGVADKISDESSNENDTEHAAEAAACSV